MLSDGALLFGSIIFFLDDLRVICDITCISLDSSFILSPGIGMV